MTRPTHAIIDTQAFVHNYRHARSLAGGARVLAVVKANAYGHGAVPLALALAGLADAFGVACLEEAQELRAAGIVDPIVLLEGVFEAGELEDVERLGLTLVVHSEHQLDWLCAAHLRRPLDVWLKMDTGMHRLGLAPAAYRAALQRLGGCAHVREVVLMSHFACADELDSPATANQLALFEGHLPSGEFAHSLANSPALLAWPQTHRDWVRPGLLLYGISPLAQPHPGADGLRPVMTLRSALIGIRDLPPGAEIGYGARYTCGVPTRVGVVAIGYADGYPRHATDGTPVAVNGRLTRLIGRVSMDMITVDLTDLPGAKLGDPVELWGGQVSASEVARAADTIPYELTCGITRRVPLVYR